MTKQERKYVPWSDAGHGPIRDTGRTRTYVKCGGTLQNGDRTFPCSGYKFVYHWSWAGHGAAKCPQCGNWWAYR